MEVSGGSKFILPDATREACLSIGWTQPNFIDSEGNLIMSIHALIIDTGVKRIIVDTCIGNDKKRNIPSWSNLQTSFLKDLEKAGYPKESIDLVMCTHLHVDHVGWNTVPQEGQRIPTFPNAVWRVSDEEIAWWNSGAIQPHPDYVGILEDVFDPIVERGKVETFSGEQLIEPFLTSIPTPGHTPGHTSFLLSSGGEHLSLIHI